MATTARDLFAELKRDLCPCGSKTLVCATHFSEAVDAYAASYTPEAEPDAALADDYADTDGDPED